MKGVAFHRRKVKAERPATYNTGEMPYVRWQGRCLSLSEWAEELEYPYRVLRCRHKRGDRGERLFRPVRKYALGTKPRVPVSTLPAAFRVWVCAP